MRPTLARRPALLAVLAVLAALALPVQAAQADRGSHGPAADVAQHSLRSAVTDEDFYFVMADRFQNGSTANDTGGLGSDPAAAHIDIDADGETFGLF